MLSFVKSIYNDYQEYKLEQSILTKYQDVCRCPSCDKIINTGFYYFDDVSWNNIIFKCKDCNIKVNKPISFLKDNILLQ